MVLLEMPLLPDIKDILYCRYLILAHNYDMCSIAHGCPWDL